MTTCPNCQSIHPDSVTCCTCGHTFASEPDVDSILTCRTRPTSITTLSWLLIVGSVFSAVWSVASLSDPSMSAVLQHSGYPPGLFYLEILLNLAVAQVCGVAMLHGKNWGRRLYVIWQLISAGILLYFVPAIAVLVPFVVRAIIWMPLLYSHTANEFFKPTESSMVV